MKVVVAIDSFKGSLSSLQAGNAVKEAILGCRQDAEVIVKPLADGGEGTVDAFAGARGAQAVEITVTGPRYQPVKATYCILADGCTAVMEMASAAGITLIPAEERNPLQTTTYGVGEIIRCHRKGLPPVYHGHWRQCHQRRRHWHAHRVGL